MEVALSVVFIAGVVTFFVLVMSVLVQVRQRLEVGELWYGMVPVGAGGALAAMLVQMGLMLIYSTVFGLPSTMTAGEVASRIDLVLFNTAVLGVLFEVSKPMVVNLFHTRVERGSWPLYGIAVGLGGGILQAIISLVPMSWVVVTGEHVVEVQQLWLLPQSLALLGMEGALGALVLYRCAEGEQVKGVALGGALHGLALLLPALLVPVVSSEVVPVLRFVCFGGCGLLAGGVVTFWVRDKGWPF